MTATNLSNSPTVALTQLYPLLGADQGPVDYQRLADLYAYPAGQTTVRANMVATIDGAATGTDGLSGGINNPADFVVFQVLRTLAQVVLVGAGTARKEGYRHIKAPAALNHLREASGITAPLELALVSRSGELPASLLEQGPGLPKPIVFTTAAGRSRLLQDHGQARVIVAERDGSVDLPTVLERLKELGLSRILTEGGPSLLAQFIDQGLLHELCLTTVNLLHPGSSLGITSAPAMAPQIHGADLGSLLYGGGTVLANWKIANRVPDTRRAQ